VWYSIVKSGELHVDVKQSQEITNQKTTYSSLNIAFVLSVRESGNSIRTRAEIVRKIQQDMSRTHTLTSTTVTTTTVQQQQQKPLKLTERIVPWKVPKLANNDTNEVSNSSNIHRTHFLLNIVGLSAPPLVIPAILLLLSKYREIPIQDHVFSIGFAVYLCAANKLRFNTNAKQVALRKSRGQTHPEKPEWFETSNEEWFDRYMASAAFLGLVLPLSVQALAPLPMAQATAPHLYLLFFQILMELMGNGPRFHPMLQVAVPIGYSAYRMASLKQWLVAAWQLTGGGDGTTLAVAHFGLALLNAIFWTYNTFIMLLLRVLPNCLDGDKFPDISISWKYQLVPVVAGESDALTSKSHSD